MDCSGELNSLKTLNSNWNQVRGNTISTHQPYRADEKWESTYVCQPDQFVALKFDTMEISKIANDILRIQLLTVEESEYGLQSLISLASKFLIGDEILY